ncbi:MAG: SWIM zinc finger family protein [Bacteroidota bacterium]
MNLTEDQIFALAPDESSKKSGRELANPSKWVSKAINEKALWGECQGSGSKPYQTQIDIIDIAFKCSCPSRKFPCKHGLGLLLLYARQKNDFKISPAPAWVEDWISKRGGKQESKTEKAEKPVDEAAQAKRQQARQKKVNDGIEELLRWIKDIIRNGIISIPEKENAWFENMARRMVDAQAPGLAGMVRNLGAVNFFSEGWQTSFMDRLLRLFMILQGYKNSDDLNESLLADIRAAIGFTQNQEELKEHKGVNDTWLVLGKQITEEDNLTTERNWLFGTNTRQYALVLQFLIRGQGAQYALTPGQVMEAELVFFPSAIPLRAIIKSQMNASIPLSVTGFGNWQEVGAFETELTSKLPFRNERPYIIEQLTPVWHNQQWWLQDNQSAIMPVKAGFVNIWTVLSLSGGAPLHMAVIGKEKEYEPVGVWYNNEYKII